jgi:spore maturation protein CgeB
MEWHVVDALAAMGCPVEFFAARSFGDARSPMGKAAQKASNLLLREPERLFERRLCAVVDRFTPQLVLVILGNQLSPKTVQSLRARTRAPVVCWCQDQMTTLGRQYLIGSHYDAVFVKDRYLQDLFSRLIRSTPFLYLPEACNPRVHRPVNLTADDRRRYGCDVMMAGTLYYYRQEILAALHAFDVRVYGNRPGWLLERLTARHAGREIVGDEKARAACAARVALNTLHYAEVDALNCRAFELAGCGAFQLIDSKAVLREHFRPGEEIESFSTVEELAEKVRYYTGHPDRALAIAQAGQRRAYREHTYEQRLAEILRVAGLAGAGELPR